MKAILILKDGTIIHGSGFGARATNVGELVFTTSMIGYQEALTDPSYAGQILLMTYPLIGNYGVDETSFESNNIQVEGFAVNSLSHNTSHRNSIQNIDSFLKNAGKPGIADIDTRFLTRKLRNGGVTNAVISTYEDSISTKELFDKLNYDYENIDFVRKVTTKEPQTFGEGKKHVVLIDYGVKQNIVRELNKRNIKVTVVPSWYSASQIKALEPNGILLSNGPGNPAVLNDAHKTIRELSDLPIFGICLGHQLIAHAFGGDTYKLKFGHRGCNHPILETSTKRVIITTQNHGFAVNPNKTPQGFNVTHLNLNDNSIEGIAHESKPIFSVQFHPESTPGPQDALYLFDKFTSNL